MDPREALKAIPSVDLAVRHLESAGLAARHPRPIVVRAVRAFLARERDAIRRGEVSRRGPLDFVRASILKSLEEEFRRSCVPALIPVVNATGIIVHTNLGRAPLASAAIAAVAEAARGYTNLEYDLAAGERGRRDLLVRDALCELSGAEDALVVNNNAAAVLLALNTLAKGREVVVSRSELIEIGGAFRLPEVFERSGAKMVAVGTTNRTKVSDYEDAIRNRTAAIMTAHWSNYEIVGFVRRVGTAELVDIGARYGIPVIHDLGSGMLADPDAVGLGGETTLRESMGAGVAVATVSGDKLLGGPQAGIAVGSAEAIGRMRSNPLSRALRPCKLTLAALEATLGLYLRGQAVKSIPVLAMLAEPLTTLSSRAESMAAELGAVLGDRADVSPVESGARVGGGAAPERRIPSRGVQIGPRSLTPGELARRMRASSPPVIVRTKGSKVLIDMRTVRPTEDRHVVAAVLAAFEVEHE